MPPAQTPNKPSENAYDFIVNKESKPKKPSFINSQTPFKQRILVILGGAVILTILIIIISSIFSSKPKTAGLLSVAQEQGTLFTLAGDASLSANQQVTRNLAINITLTMTTGQLNVINYIKGTGTKIVPASLHASNVTQLSSELTSTPANNFDSLYVQLTQNTLSSYITTLKSAYSSTLPLSQKLLLSNLYASATLLTKEANSTSSDL